MLQKLARGPPNPRGGLAENCLGKERRPGYAGQPQSSKHSIPPNTGLTNSAIVQHSAWC